MDSKSISTFLFRDTAANLPARLPELLVAAQMTDAIIPTKIKVGIEMLNETRDGEFDAAQALLQKVLGNVVANPTEDKYRKLRTSNNKIAQLLATRGVRALLRGAGFVEDGEFLVLAMETPVDGTQNALSELQAAVQQRASAAEATKQAALQERKANQEMDSEQRKVMKMQIDDDAAARKEPGWTAKAAGVKGGRDIVTASDIGASGNAGG